MQYLCVYIGKDGNILEEQPENCKVLKIKHPILTNTDILKLLEISEKTLLGVPVEQLISDNERTRYKLQLMERQIRYANREGK